MPKIKFSAMARLLLVLIVLFLGTGPCLAQSTGNANSNGQSTQTASPTSCRRCTTSKDRWAAAAHHANRRAEHIRKSHGKVSK
jgi:hypothetical protein